MQEEIRFLVDGMLGRCAKWLRFLGYDAVYFTLHDKFFLSYQALNENRMVLTRDRMFFERHRDICLFVESERYLEQLVEVKRKAHLRPDPAAFFSRCGECNVLLVARTPGEAGPLVPPYVRETQKKFSLCPSCGKIYWQGTHWERMANVLMRI